MIGFIACCALAMIFSAAAGAALTGHEGSAAVPCGVITIACFVGAYLSIQ